MKTWLKRITYTLISLMLIFMYIGYTNSKKEKNNDSSTSLEPKIQKTSKMERMLTNYYICDIALKKGDRGRSFEEGLSWYSKYEQDKTKDSYYSLLPNGILVVLSERSGIGYRCTYDKELTKVEFLTNIQLLNGGYDYSIDSRMTSKFKTKDIWTPEMQQIVHELIKENKQ